jgi:hypothetical protein
MGSAVSNGGERGDTFLHNAVINSDLSQIGIHLLYLAYIYPAIFAHSTESSFQDNAGNHGCSGLIACTKELLRLFQLAFKYFGLNEIAKFIQVASFIILLRCK